MSLRFDCVRCGKKLKAHFDQAGALVKCTGCGEVQRAPAPDHVAPPEPEESGDGPLVSARKGAGDDELDMTPMIDMTFLLLIFFMITASFALQKSLPIPPPQPENKGVQARPNEDDKDEQDEVTVKIDAQSVISVQDQRVGSRQDLIAQLRDARNGVGGPPCRRLVIEVHGEARHEAVVLVLDVGTEVGMSSMAVKSSEEES